MRIILLVMVAIIQSALLNGQNSKADTNQYACIESIVDSFYTDNEIKDIFGQSKQEFKLSIHKNQGLAFISNDKLTKFIFKLTEYSLVACIRNIIDEEISKWRYHADSVDYLIRINNLNDKMDIVDDFMNLLTSNTYIHYNFQQSSKTLIKSFHLYHDNDIFLFSKLNADRDYTGGFKFEFMTDQFKMRIFKNLGNSNEFLSYQSVFIGGEAYTPYIRFTEDELKQRNIFYEIDDESLFFTEASLDSIQNYMRVNQQMADRPFASFQYVGRGKYRLHNDGFLRSESFFKIGIIGKNLGKNIQAVIHQDLTTDSQRVLNWEDQIAHGGRLAFSIEHKVDVSIFSTHSILSLTKRFENEFVNLLAFNTNVYMPIEVALGTVQTYAGLGIGISNKSFIDISGINDPKYFKNRGDGMLSRIWLNTYLSMEYNYKYVVHNSMLEGVGIINTFDDDPLDDEAVTIYRLDKESIERNLHKLQFHIGYRANRITIYYKHVRYINEEFKVNGVEPEYEEFSTSRWYGFGRIGLNFML